MKSFLLLRRSAFLALASIFVSQLSQAQQLVKFPRLDGSGSESAMVIPIDTEGLYVTVGVMAADVAKGKSGETNFELVAQDSQSRLTLLKGPKPAQMKFQLGNGRDLTPGAQLKAGLNKTRATVVSWENYFHEQLLPLSFLRVHHQGRIPSPGTPLIGVDGKISAICHQPGDSFGNGTYALPIEAVRSMVSGFKKHGKIRRSYCGMILDARDPVLSVVGVRPDSPVTRGGLKKDDIIIKIAGLPVRNFAEANDVTFYLVADEEVEFVVIRGAEVKTLKVTPIVDPRHLDEKAGEDAPAKEGE